MISIPVLVAFAGHHLLRKIYFDCTAVQAEDSVDTEIAAVSLQQSSTGDVEAPDARNILSSGPAAPAHLNSSDAILSSSTRNDAAGASGASLASMHGQRRTTPVFCAPRASLTQRCYSDLRSLPSNSSLLNQQWLQRPVLERAAEASTSSPIYGLIVTKHGPACAPARSLARRKSYPTDTCDPVIEHQHSFASRAQCEHSPFVSSTCTLNRGRPFSGKGASRDSSAFTAGANRRESDAANIPHQSAAADDSFDDSLSTGNPLLYERAPSRGLVLVPGVRRRMAKDANPSPVLPNGDALSDGPESLLSGVPGHRNSGGARATSVIEKPIVRSISATSVIEKPIVSAPATSQGSCSGASGGSGAPGSAKAPTIMEAIAEDMHDLQETVHQLDGEALDAGYGEVKSPLRHVRTRLYFTSESHVHGIVNTLKHWAASPEVLASRLPARAEAANSDTSNTLPQNAGGSGATAFCSSAASSAPVRLVSPDGMRLLDATPELDYLTHIVFRLCEFKREGDRLFVLTI